MGFLKFYLAIILLSQLTILRSLFPKIFVRHDQTRNDVLSKAYQNDSVTIVAPEWVRDGLVKLSKHIPSGTQFDVYDKNGRFNTIIIEGELSLKHLVMIARNEPFNTDGSINYTNYEPTITDKSVIHALKDLVRQCVIVARDETTHYGGYPRGVPIEQRGKVYIADLIGLQFQNRHNSGRLVLIGNDLPKGLLDDFIFRKVVGEDKKSYKETDEDRSGRYVKHEDVYFDTIAYKKFVTNDVLITGLALNEIAKEELNFKFLKYGSGFFAGPFSQILGKYIYGAVAEGLDKLFSHKNQKRIKFVELPFYEYNQSIADVCQKHQIECKFSEDDALKVTHPKYVNAITNCADPHAITGNEMRYSSVDAAIAENLKSKANIFSPIINQLIKEKFIPIDVGLHRNPIISKL
jgi:hypothetical protein